MSTILNNIQTKIIGRMQTSALREKFCKAFNIPECLAPLEKIEKAGRPREEEEKSSKSIYTNAFLFLMDTGKKAIGRVSLPMSLTESRIYKKKSKKDGEVSSSDFEVDFEVDSEVTEVTEVETASLED